MAYFDLPHSNKPVKTNFLSFHLRKRFATPEKSFTQIISVMWPKNLELVFLGSLFHCFFTWSWMVDVFRCSQLKVSRQLSRHSISPSPGSLSPEPSLSALSTDFVLFIRQDSILCPLTISILSTAWLQEQSLIRCSSIFTHQSSISFLNH